MTLLKNALARLVLGLLALSSAAWATFFLYNSDPCAQMNNVADGILSGAGFKQYPLSESALLASAEGRYLQSPRGESCRNRPTSLFEVATDASDTRLADRRLKSLRSSVNGALGCAPTDGFLWFIAYWSAINQGDAVSDHLEELRRSYTLAPFAGWIALRSPYVPAVYDNIPGDLQGMARNESVAIVATGLIRDRVRILKGSGLEILQRADVRSDKSEA